MNWLALLVVLGMIPSIGQSAQVAVRLIHATNAPGPAANNEFRDATPRLQKAFGWREYHVLSRTAASLRENDVRQMDLGQHLTLRVKLLKDQHPLYFMRCELLRDEKDILQTTVSMTSGSSYFITGPAYDGGQLLISIAVR